MSYWIEGALVPSADLPIEPFGHQPNRYTAVDVAIAAGAIAAITPTETQPCSAGAERVDGRDKLLLPGWVNAHTHSPEMWTRGWIPPLPLELWLAELYAHPLRDTEQVYLAALLTALETLQSGGTTVVDHLVLLPGRELESIAAADRAYRNIGIRAYIAPLIQDEPFEYSLPGGRGLEVQSIAPSTREVLQWLATAVEQFHRPAEGISIVLAPTGIQLCSEDLLEGCVALSQAQGLCRHSHLLETKAQALLAAEKYGMTAVDYLATVGFLGPETSLAHCVWLSDRDTEIVAESGTTVVHNPLSNLRLGSGIAPILNYVRQGVNVSFGCDGAASNDGQNLLEVLKIGSMLHNVTDFEYRHWLSPQQVSRMASQGGAKGLNTDAFGRLAVGQEADLMLFDLQQSELLPPTDPLGQLIWGRPSQPVHSAWVRGKQIIAAGQMLTIEVDYLKDRLLDYPDWLTNRSEGMRDRLERHYRRVMGLSDGDTPC
jgi:cytosine/adenosine deaminase-related metal-dependent hydrolase